MSAATDPRRNRNLACLLDELGLAAQSGGTRGWAHRLPVLASVLLALTWVRPARADDTSSSTQPRIVNVTSDSAQGWLPSTDQARAATDAVLAYLSAKDAGHAEAAYAMLAGETKALLSFADFARAVAEFNARAGAVAERKIVNVTWTKDPAQGPRPGVYAAIDIVSRFANIDRDCGFVVAYQAPAGGAFAVAREEENLLTNADAAVIERQHAKSGVNLAWSRLSARCPNYPGYEPFHSPARASGGAAPLAEQPSSTIGYATVEAALSDLRSRHDVTFRPQGGYTVATDEASHAIWVFTSEGQPAYPAAIKREFVTDAKGGTSIEMTVLCEASKAACDDLVRTFKALDDRIAAEVKGGR